MRTLKPFIPLSHSQQCCMQLNGLKQGCSRAITMPLMWQLCTAQPQLLSPSYPASRYGTWKCTPLNRHILARPASRISIQRKQTAAALPGKTSTTTAKSNSNGSSSSSSSSTTHQQLGDVFTPAERETFDVVVIGAGIGGLSCAALLAYYGFKVVCCESHTVPGGAAHCWLRRGCHFDSGTALFFGLPAAAAAAAAAGPFVTPNLTRTAAGGAAAAAALAGKGFPASYVSSSITGHADAATAAAATATAASPLQHQQAVGQHGSSDNPLAAVLELLDEPLDLIAYGPERTRLVFPEGSFNAQIGSHLFADVVGQLWGVAAKQEWLQLQQLCNELAAAAVALHPVVVRYDPWVALTAAARHPLRFAKFITSKPPLLADDVMFSQLVSSVVRCPQLLQFVDVLCQGTSGAPAAALPAAYMVRAFSQMYQPGTRLQWPRGGPQAIADALVCGLSKHGGKLLLNCHVQQILQGPEGQAAGVVLKDGSVIRARNAVVSNASTWDTLKLMPQGAQLQQFERQVSNTQPSDSFVHLHAVVDVPPGTDVTQLPVHSYFLAPNLVGDTGWPTLTISTAVDDTLAPPGKQILHAYMAEPYAPWAGLSRGSAQYQQLKQQRAEQLWGLIDQVVPWARDHLDWQMVGTPLTHQHFRRRFMGAYGPKDVHNPFKPKISFAASAAAAELSLGGGGVEQEQQQQLEGALSSPQPTVAMKGLYCCGDCTFPWIGTPAVAASGMWVANTLAPVWKHWAAANVVDK